MTVRVSTFPLLVDKLKQENRLWLLHPLVPPHNGNVIPAPPCPRGKNKKPLSTLSYRVGHHYSVKHNSSTLTPETQSTPFSLFFFSHRSYYSSLVPLCKILLSLSESRREDISCYLSADKDLLSHLMDCNLRKKKISTSSLGLCEWQCNNIVLIAPSLDKAVPSDSRKWGLIVAEMF